jgi:hypothetical protein
VDKGGVAEEQWPRNDPGTPRDATRHRHNGREKAMASSPCPPSPPGRQPSKGLAIASLVLGVLSLFTLGCLGVGALAGITLGIVALVKAGRSPQEYGGKGMAIGGIVCSGLALLLLPLAIIAAIAIPSLMRARVSANEASAIGDIRTMISGQVAYSVSNGGFYDTPACLAAPDGCLRDYEPGMPTFIDAEQASLVDQRGYRWRFYQGPSPSRAQIQRQGLSPSSIESFAYVAVPISPGTTGIRGFCGDSTGRICFSADGSEPPVVGGLCAPDCMELR